MICPGTTGAFLYAFLAAAVNLLFVPEHVKAGATLQEILSVIPEAPILDPWRPSGGGFSLPEGLTEVISAR